MHPVGVKLAAVGASVVAGAGGSALLIQALASADNNVLTAVAGISIAVLLALYLFLLRSQFANQREFGKLEERSKNNSEKIDRNRDEIDGLRGEITTTRHQLRNEIQVMMSDFHERLGKILEGRRK